MAVAWGVARGVADVVMVAEEWCLQMYQWKRLLAKVGKDAMHALIPASYVDVDKQILLDDI